MAYSTSRPTGEREQEQEFDRGRDLRQERLEAVDHGAGIDHGQVRIVVRQAVDGGFSGRRDVDRGDQHG
ncbi:hypothetical protein LP420_18120 [Massilia sp. B-10]|nr:hypothetical protein LP420_18120 [Massilia sp. B-10]